MATDYGREEIRERYGMGERTLVDRLRENWIGYVFVFPVLLALAFLFYIPLIRGIWISFLDEVVSGENLWVGIENYEWLLTNDLFIYALGWTLIFVFSTTALQLIVGLSVSLIANELASGYREWAAAIMFSPYFGAAVAAGIIVRFYLSPTFGVMGRLFTAMGLEPIYFLTQGIWPFVSLIIGTMWHDYAYAAIIYIAALQGIPSDQYEAAAIDGASRLQRFRAITVPHLLTPTIIVLAIRTAYNVAEFAIPLEMTGGGPGTRTMVLSILTYNTAYVDLQFGRAAAIGNVMTLIAISSAVFYITVIREESELYL